MRIQQTSRLITVSVVALSALAIVCAWMARQVRFAQEQAYERRRLMFGFADQLARDAGLSGMRALLRSTVLTP